MTTTERIILSIVSIIMLVLTMKKGDKWPIILTSGLTIGVLITWTEIPVIITAGLIIYMMTALMISFSNLRTKELSRLTQVTIVLTGVWAFGTHLISIMQWPFAREIRLSMIIPIILYVISLVKEMIKRRELGYMTIMNVEFVLRLIR